MSTVTTANARGRPLSPNDRDDGQRRDRRQARDRPLAEHRPLEQQVSRQEERRTAKHGGRGIRAGVPEWVRDDQLVADGGDDDPGYHRDVEVGVGKPPRRPGSLEDAKACSAASKLRSK